MQHHLLTLSPTEFEHAVTRLFPYLGCRDARRTGGTGDLGVDIVCFDGHGGLVAVQCKRYAPGNNVTSPNIQQFFGMLVHHGARRGIYVTTSSFTKSALELAEARDIKTIDGQQLVALFAAHPELLGFPGKLDLPRAVPLEPPPRRLPPEPPADPPEHEKGGVAKPKRTHWQCLGCNQWVLAGVRRCPTCKYAISPQQWRRKMGEL